MCCCHGRNLKAVYLGHCPTVAHTSQLPEMEARGKSKEPAVPALPAAVVWSLHRAVHVCLLTSVCECLVCVTLSPALEGAMCCAFPDSLDQGRSSSKLSTRTDVWTHGFLWWLLPIWEGEPSRAALVRKRTLSLFQNLKLFKTRTKYYSCKIPIMKPFLCIEGIIDACHG